VEWAACAAAVAGVRGAWLLVAAAAGAEGAAVPATWRALAAEVARGAAHSTAGDAGFSQNSTWFTT
jgi:hypothetical protein